METKTLVIFIAGGVAGYLLSQYMMGKIEGVTPPTSTTPVNEDCSPCALAFEPAYIPGVYKNNVCVAPENSGCIINEPAPSPGNLNPKVIDCQNKLNAQLASLNLPADKVQDYSDTFMANCLTSI